VVQKTVAKATATSLDRSFFLEWGQGFLGVGLTRKDF